MYNSFKYDLVLVFCVLCILISLTIAISIATYKLGYLTAKRELLKEHFESKYEIKEVEHAVILFEKKK